MPDNNTAPSPALNIIEKEIRALFRNTCIIYNPKFIGTVCIGKLNQNGDSDAIVRAELRTGTVTNKYNVLEIRIINRNYGRVDTLSLDLQELTKCNDIYYVNPDKFAWGRLQSEPSDNMREQIRDAVNTYLEPFRYVV